MDCQKVLTPPIGVSMMAIPPECPEIDPCPCSTGSGTAGEVEISNWDEMPLGIEVSTPAAFCLVDADGNVIGKTFLCKVVDEVTGAESFTKKALLLNGGDPIDFDPAIHTEALCDSKSCADASIINVTGDDVTPAIGVLANEIQVVNTCCEVVIKTSIGEILIPNGQNFHDEYECPLTIEEITVTGDCDKSDIKFTFKNG